MFERCQQGDENKLSDDEEHQRAEIDSAGKRDAFAQGAHQRARQHLQHATDRLVGVDPAEDRLQQHGIQEDIDAELEQADQRQAQYGATYGIVCHEQGEIAQPERPQLQQDLGGESQ